eukprot:jgi/Mesvir1/14957/Mv14627-RA.2
MDAIMQEEFASDGLELMAEGRACTFFTASCDPPPSETLLNWEGDAELTLDQYDIRLAVGDKNLFQLPRQGTAKERGKKRKKEVENEMKPKEGSGSKGSMMALYDLEEVQFEEDRYRDLPPDEMDGIPWKQVQGAHWLRTQCCLVGALVGTLVGYSQQNVVAGLPLMLMAEEMAIGLSRGYLRLVGPCASLDTASPLASGTLLLSPGPRLSCHRGDPGSEQDMSRKQADDDAATTSQGGDDGAAPRQQAHDAAVLATATDGPVARPTPTPSPSGEGLPQASAKGQQDALPETSQYPVSVDTTSSYSRDTTSLTRKRSKQGAQGAARDVDWESAVVASEEGMVELPLTRRLPRWHERADASSAGDSPAVLADATARTLEEAAAILCVDPDSLLMQRCRVFEDLLLKGYRMTVGVKFGADYLAYPGDPVDFHAYFTVTVVDADSIIPAILISGGSRVSNAARKSMVYASVDKKTKQVVYVTAIPDTGFATRKAAYQAARSGRQ